MRPWMGERSRSEGAPRSVPRLKTSGGLWTRDCPHDMALGPFGTVRCVSALPRVEGRWPRDRETSWRCWASSLDIGRVPWAVGVSWASGPFPPGTPRPPHFAKSALQLGADVWDPHGVCPPLPATVGAGGGVRKTHPVPPAWGCSGEGPAPPDGAPGVPEHGRN